MSMFAKIMVVVNLILAVIFLAAAGTLHGATESWKDKHEKDVRDLKTQLEGRDATIVQRDASIGDLNKNLAAARSRADQAEGLHKQIVESNTLLKIDSDKKQGLLDAMTAQNTEAQKTITDQGQRISTIESALSTEKAEKATANDKIRTLEENLTRETARGDNAEKASAVAELRNRDLTESLDKYTTELTAYKKTYPPIGTAVSMQKVDGKVSASSAKDDVHVLNVGSNDKVEVGYEFTVYRGSNYIATIVIDYVQPTMCSGRIKAGTKKAEIQPGDDASTRL